MAEPTLFLHPRIHTLASEEPIDGGIVAIDGRIAFIGKKDEARAFAGEGAREVELEGAAVLPAFHDAHIHSGMLALDRMGPDLRPAATYAEALAILADFNTQNPGDSWVLGGSWNANPWSDGYPHKSDLDRIFGARPVLLSTIDGHAAWANSAALEAGGIDHQTPDPDGGRIVRIDGDATGILLESAAGLVDDVAYPSVQSMIATLLEGTQDELLSMGIAHITDIDGEDVREGYLALQDQGRLRLRVNKAVRVSELDIAIAAGRTDADGDDWVTTGAVKFFSDGALGPHTAHFHEDFEGEEGNSGIAVTDAATLRAGMARATDAGLAVMVHAIGDKANTIVLDAFETIAEEAHAKGLRGRIEHAQHLKPADIERFARLGVIASMQPTHCTSDYPLSVQLLGKRNTLHYPWRTLLDSGAALAFGSDAPVEPAEPFFAIHAAVTRRRRDGEPDGGREPEERISVREALFAHTLGPAYAASLEDRTGSLEVGKFADFIAVDQDPFETDPQWLWQTKVLTTVVGGEVRFALRGD